MAELGRVLRESFRLLVEEPRLFVPKLISATLSSLWMLGLISGRIPYLYAVAALPAIGFIGVFVSVMVASMVKSRGDEVLVNGFRDTLQRWRSVAVATGAVLFTGFVVSLPFSLGLYSYLIQGSTVFLLAGSAVTLLLLLVFSFAAYFLPIGLYEKKGFLDGLRSSVTVSAGNARDVSALTLFSFAMLGVAAVAGSGLEVLGAAGFLIGRLTSSVVGTYLFVVSPSYYLER
ncbi:MAG: hypothetical protein ABEJ98_03120 [Candidatus Nanohaloarchaea archaeon]